ncbi:hypothetical protein PLICRDRAFT_54338 [Plicaturopsis crispa FD-325 SS-3]|nr:hypothetical protein PLICRDRAFT_54338 [Plicaturopsis crispa FD-325 SS-3]
MPMPLVLRAPARPELALVKTMCAEPMHAQLQAMEKMREDRRRRAGTQAAENISVILCNWIKFHADDLRDRREYAAAIEKYKEAMREIVGPNLELLKVEYINPKYLSMTTEDGWKPHLDLVACCDAIAYCYREQGKLLEALDWLQEVEVLYITQRLGSRPDQLPFMNVNLPLEDHFAFRMEAGNRYSDILFDLGNTASSTFFSFRNVGTGGALDIEDTPTIERLRRQEIAFNKVKLRHPEPKFVDKFKVTNDALQVRGAWTKLKVGPSPPHLSRLSFSGWIWQSKMYVCGGHHWKVKRLVLQDLWCLDLIKRDGWRELPSFPEGVLLSHKMQVHGHMVYLFRGNKTVWAFDLVAEKWTQIQTTFTGKWPYFRQLTEHCVEIFEDVMYVFSGDDARTDLGTNVFMALDLKTMKWTYLGGHSESIATNEMPMLRRHASSWVVPAQKRLYILYGNICRSAAKMHNKPYGDKEDYNYEDMWSYSIPSKKWRRERLRGNFPSPRTEMACVYSESLGHTFVYGGYNASTYCVVGNIGWEFAYYGDTFMLDPETLIWKHVVTRGFPSYRAQSQMMVDEATGKIYLFGGYTNSDFIPSKHLIQRTFGDVWQLCVDMPGGHIEDVDLERDTLAPKMGPWMRCFACGSVGDTWKKCGGSCKGAYFFCSTDCLRDAWKEHKQTTGCRKV